MRFNRHVSSRHAQRRHDPRILSHTTLGIPGNGRGIRHPLQTLHVTSTHCSHITYLRRRVFVTITFICGGIICTRQARVSNVIFPRICLRLRFNRLNFGILFPNFRSFLRPTTPMARDKLLRRFRTTLRVNRFFQRCIMRNFFKLQGLTGLIIYRSGTVPIIILSF